MSDRTTEHGDDAPGARRQSEAAAVAEIVRRHIATDFLDVERPSADHAPILAIPEGLRLEGVKRFLDEYLDNPERRTGTARLQDLASLIAHVNRFKDADSALFADRNMDAPAITAVLDYHQAVNAVGDADDEAAKGTSKPKPAADRDAAPLPRFCQHRAHYPFPLSDEWKAWKAADGEQMAQAEFAEFLEDRIGDVIAPPDFANAPSDDESTAKLAELAQLLGGAFASPTRPAGSEWDAFRSALQAFQRDRSPEGAAAVRSTHRAFLAAFLPDQPAEADRQHAAMCRRIEDALAERTAA